MRKSFRVFASLSSFLVLVLILGLMTTSAARVMAQARGEIRVVESWRPDTNILGHNVLQHLYLAKEHLVPTWGRLETWELLISGTRVRDPGALFPRIEGGK